MTLTDEEVLRRLRKKQCELMMNFTANNDPLISKSYNRIETLKKIVKMQELIDNLTMKIALEKGEVYTTKFGQAVCSKEEFNYWNSVFDEIYFAEDVENSFGYQLHYEYQQNMKK